MKLIITGATGHIGNNIARQAVSQNFHATCLLRREGRATLDIPCKKKIGDLFSKEFLLKNIQSGDTVVHSAGYIDLSDKNKTECYRVNYDLTRLIAEVCLEKGAHLIYVGTVDAILKEGDGKICESEYYYPERLSGNYAKSKAEATKYLLDLIKAHPDFLCDIILPTAVIGPHDYKPSAAGRIIRSVLSGMPEIGVEGGYDFVGAEDVARAVIALAQKPCREQFILSGERVSVKELYEKINLITGKRRKIFILPKRAASLFLDKITLKALTEHRIYSSEKAKKLLSYTPAPFDKVLFDTIKFFTIDKFDK